MTTLDKSTVIKDQTTTSDSVNLDNKTLQSIGVEILPVHTEGTVHAKRISGTFRSAKWIAAAFWLIFFTFPYLRWDGHQAFLFDMENRQFHILNLTILPQDIWVLAMILLFFALLLAASTAVAGRMWCGYFCFHTVWSDIFTWLEEKFEGQPHKRNKLDQQSWSLEKIKIKLPKWAAWAGIAFLTGFSFVAYFSDAYDLWARLFSFEWGTTEATVILVLAASTYFFAGILREQTCIGFCPYARIQGAMIDTQTVVPTYDVDRGEPRGRVKRPKPGEEVSELGDCIDCNLCVAVCPTGVDIRLGQQFGCITCGLCIDACDSIMDKIKKPRGLIRYASLAEFSGKKLPPLLKRPRVVVYGSIMAFAAIMIVYGLFTMSPIDVKALHERSPLFVKMSDGSIQNKWVVKVVNKSNQPLHASISVTGHEGLTVIVDELIKVQAGNVGSTTLFVRIPHKALDDISIPLNIHVQDINNPDVHTYYKTNFLSPKRR